jgi:hypothetical protein
MKEYMKEIRDFIKGNPNKNKGPVESKTEVITGR